jgi:hypothetical protein
MHAPRAVVRRGIGCLEIDRHAWRQLFGTTLIVVNRQRQLPQTVLTLAPPRGLSGGLNRRQQERYQNADNRDDD